MSNLSDFAEQATIDHVLLSTAYAPNSTVYLGLSTVDPLDDGTGITEPVGNGYVRQEISFRSPVGRTITQNGDVTFPEATGAWGVILFYCIFDAEVGGNFLGYAALTNSKDVIAGSVVIIIDSDTVISILPSGISTVLANLILGWLFRGDSLPQATNLYVALCSSEIADADTGSDLDDLIMTDYARELAVNWTPASGALAASDNITAISFSALTGASETITATAIVDHLTGGNVLWYDNDLNDVVAPGNAPNFPIGDWNVTLD